MFTKLYLQNYMSFRDLTLNLNKGKNPKKIVAVYGENGAGKSNIVSAFMNLALSLLTYSNQNILTENQAKLTTMSEISENEEKNRQMNKLLKSILKSTESGTNISRVFEDAYSVDTIDPMIIRFGFVIDGYNGYYELTFKKTEDGRVFLAKEELKYLINKTTGILFTIMKDTNNDKIKTKFSPSFIVKSSKNGKDAATMVDQLIDKFWGKHSFLSLFKNIEDETNGDYVKRNFSTNFLKVLCQLRSVAVKSDKMTGFLQFTKLLRNLTSGNIQDTKQNQQKIILTTQALNKYFVPLYSDILKVEYSKENDKDGYISYQLIELKRLAGKELSISFDRESHGTKQLLELFPLFLNAVNGEVVVIDELDAGIHDLLVERLVNSLKNDISGQLIFTTHDTQLMGEVEPSSLYIIQNDSYGNKQVTNLTKSDISENNNVEKMYLNGFFAGIPYSEDVDFADILESIEEFPND